MADDTIASVIPLHQIPLKKRDKKSVARAKVYRPRKKRAKPASVETEDLSSESLIPPEFLPTEAAPPEPPVAPPSASHPDKTPSREYLAPVLLSIAALALAAVGITINGWFARSLGSSDVAGWLFLAVGVAADLVALVMPSCAAGLWQTGQRATAMVGWAIWLMTFVFAVTAGIGFASTNISDVAIARAARVTPAITNAQAALTDAMAARDRECK